MPIDYTTASDVFAYGKVANPTSAETAVMEDFITAVSRKADNTCVQRLSYTVYTNKILTPRIDVSGTLILYLPSPTITSLTSVTMRTGNVPLTQPINFIQSGVQYDIVEQSFGSKVIIYGYPMTPYRESILRAYVTWAGGWANLAAVPYDFQFAIQRWTWFAYKQREAPFDRTAVPELGIITIPGSIPPDVTDVLNRYTWYYR
jgi:hypothetical protein